MVKGAGIPMRRAPRLTRGSCGAPRQQAKRDSCGFRRASAARSQSRPIAHASPAKQRITQRHRGTNTPRGSWRPAKAALARSGHAGRGRSKPSLPLRIAVEEPTPEAIGRTQPLEPLEPLAQATATAQTSKSGVSPPESVAPKPRLAAELNRVAESARNFVSELKTKTMHGNVWEWC
jgi:hypothetical protein